MKELTVIWTPALLGVPFANSPGDTDEERMIWSARTRVPGRRGFLSLGGRNSWSRLRRQLSHGRGGLGPAGAAVWTDAGEFWVHVQLWPRVTVRRARTHARLHSEEVWAKKFFLDAGRGGIYGCMERVCWMNRRVRVRGSRTRCWRGRTVRGTRGHLELTDAAPPPGRTAEGPGRCCQEPAAPRGCFFCGGFFVQFKKNNKTPFAHFFFSEGNYCHYLVLTSQCHWRKMKGNLPKRTPESLFCAQ